MTYWYVLDYVIIGRLYRLHVTVTWFVSRGLLEGSGRFSLLRDCSGARASARDVFEPGWQKPGGMILIRRLRKVPDGATWRSGHV